MPAAWSKSRREPWITSRLSLQADSAASRTSLPRATDATCGRARPIPQSGNVNTRSNQSTLKHAIVCPRTQPSPRYRPSPKRKVSMWIGLASGMATTSGSEARQERHRWRAIHQQPHLCKSGLRVDYQDSSFKRRAVNQKIANAMSAASPIGAASESPNPRQALRLSGAPAGAT
jgi:hypothetical protein